MKVQNCNRVVEHGTSTTFLSIVQCPGPRWWEIPSGSTPICHEETVLLGISFRKIHARTTDIMTTGARDVPRGQCISSYLRGRLQ